MNKDYKIRVLSGVKLDVRTIQVILSVIEGNLRSAELNNDEMDEILMDRLPYLLRQLDSLIYKQTAIVQEDNRRKWR